MFYLLHIIKQQKQLAEVKNDLISNITHEFKTPITTVHTALEAIKNFDILHNPEKTHEYLNMSTQQLDKLNLMVEKLLETAVLDSKTLLLKKEKTSLLPFIQKLHHKHQTLAAEKTIQLEVPDQDITIDIDAFHFENALNNLMDNAIKYGGDTISIKVSSTLENVVIDISDNGDKIPKLHSGKIFEKFYRIPQGNLHSVKGFGIGLYYTKNIIEKHEGFIELVRHSNLNIFRIKLPI